MIGWLLRWTVWTVRTSGTARTTRATRPSAGTAATEHVLHILELLLLVVGKNLAELAVDVLLKFLEFLLLLVSQLQPILDGGRENLAGLGRPSEAAEPTRPARSAGAEPAVAEAFKAQLKRRSSEVLDGCLLVVGQTLQDIIHRFLLQSL